MEIKIPIKPLSVNEAWQGVRYKTPAYNRYEKAVLLMLPCIDVTNVKRLEIEYGFSSKLADIDNPTKMTLDILQKKYGFNDRDIFELVLRKSIVKKGEEYILIRFN